MSRVFACTDLHGNKILYDKINNFLNKEDIVYFLGDAADRGKDGWEIIKSLKDNKQWIWIRGNHDQMLVDRILGHNCYQAAALHVGNGGSSTWEAVEKDTDKFGFEFIKDIADYIKELPYKKEYINKNRNTIYMSHSGDISDISEDLMWNRNHFIIPIQNDGHIIDYVIHGHTPIPYLVDILEGYNDFFETPMIIDENINPHAYWYMDHTKCCLDCCTILTNSIVLLDLDTFEEHLFSVES